MTRQRRVILEEVHRVRSHPTADEVYARVRRRLPRVSLGTVYRNLEVLAAAGEIRRIECPGGQRRYDGEVADHFHIRCVMCGRLGDVRPRPLPAMAGVFRDATDFTIMGFRLELLGVCRSCRKRSGVKRGGGRPRATGRRCEVHHA